MELKESDYSIVSNGSTITLEGKLELPDYKHIIEFLDKIDSEIGEDKISFNIRNLQFLDSRGIRALAIFFKKCVKKVEIAINPDITWQKVGVTPLCSIRPAGDIVIY